MSQQKEQAVKLVRWAREQALEQLLQDKQEVIKELENCGSDISTINLLPPDDAATRFEILAQTFLMAYKICDTATYKEAKISTRRGNEKVAVLTRKECADTLKISIRHLDRLMQKENLPVIHLGGKTVRIRITDLEKWLDGIR